MIAAPLRYAAHALPAKLSPVVDWFTPPGLKADAEVLRRVRMFLISHLLGPFLGHSISVFLLVLQPHPAGAWWVFAGAITLFWLYPFALRATGWFVPLALLSVQNLIFTILWGCFQYGGLSSPLIPWVITVPLLALFYLGSGRAVLAYVSAIVLVNGGLFWAFSVHAGSFPEHIPLSALSGLGILSTVCAAIYVSMMALYYASIVGSQSELEQEVVRRIETAQQLRQATTDAEQANHAKSEFLAKMSHELRTPLNAVIGYSAILLTDAEDENREQQICDLRKIQDAGQHLLTMINDLLDLSKIEAGKMELYLETVDLSALVRDVADGLETAIAASGSRLAIACPDRLPSIQADTMKLAQIVSNLLSNAVKFGQGGPIEVAVSNDGTWAGVVVRDHGRGIEAAKLPGLFETFEEAEGATTTKYGSIGLGLPLSRRLCRLMGGDVTVESELGGGSCFVLRVPSGCSDAPEPAEGAPGPDARRAGSPQNSLLVVDDDPAVLEMVRRVLEPEGYAVTATSDAFEVLELARSNRPACILLDVHMPELDGWQLLQLLREDPDLADCTIAMLTVESNAQESRQRGADAHFVKPVATQDLIRFLRQIGLEPAAGAALQGVADP